ncbi:MAG: S-layer protein, partial [Clostridiaceae bacterium]|nr:S-layer protein [Clostridiaceae bacterium]
GALPAYIDEELVFDGMYNIASLTFLPDHIYDITFSFKDSEGTPVQFTNKYGELTEQETLFFLSKITFQGTSFNDVAVLGGLEDANPDLIQSGGQTIRVISGNDPKVTLRWKVPTIWEPSVDTVLHITNENVNLDRLESGGTSHVDLDYGYFHIKMNEVTDIVTERIFTTTVQEGTGDIIVSQSGDLVEGFGPDGSVTAADGFVYFTLDQSDGILPGTEYENVNIKLTFRSGFSEAPYTRLSSAASNFLIENKDNIFQTTGGQVTSIFTPLWFEASKVDVDKLELKIYKIKSRNYTELYYEVQDAGSIVELLEDPAQAGSGIKLPDASIPDATGWGSVIVEIPIDQNGEHPLRFYRFVVTDGDSLTPLGSLAINLQLLGNDTGKPPVPREIEAEPLYSGKHEVVYKNPQVPVSVNIPLSDIRISFEKPLVWMTRPWNEIVSGPDDEGDFTFHLLLNTYLSDDIKMVETKEIGDEEVSVFVPVKEKRMLSFGKHQLKEDPNDSTRVYFELDGSKLFYDYVRDVSLDYENDIDYDINGNGDYPDFLVPNTTYYLRMFSTRLKNHDDVNWALRDELEFENDISYISPMVSFTTYPTREKPVPLPNLSLDIDFEPEPDPETGKPVMNGIIVEFPKIINDNDWLNYTNITEGRRIVYDIYISDSADEESFILLDSAFLDPLETLYPDENPDALMSVLISVFPVGDGEELKPNTTYYFTAQAKLYVDGEDEPFISSDMTPIKSITTPKTDSGDLDDLDRSPRTPVEFSIARDSEGELELTDSKVAFNWLHAEKDVTYEMVVTRKKLA